MSNDSKDDSDEVLISVWRVELSGNAAAEIHITLSEGPFSMTSALLVLLLIPTGTEVRTTGPRVIALQHGQVVQVWPSRPVPNAITPHREWPAARPFGPQPIDNAAVTLPRAESRKVAGAKSRNQARTSVTWSKTARQELILRR
jgi:hypothetical protein